ncbi:MAG: 2TM domain-containing protein [Flavisolibacter sp.]
MQALTETQLRELAKKRVEFRAHFLVYCVINSLLWIIWLVTGRGYPWPVWPLAGWGIGVLFQYLFDYRSSRFLSMDDEYKKLKRKMEEHIGAV